jgi:membrane dipeptidase
MPNKNHISFAVLCLIVLSLLVPVGLGRARALQKKSQPAAPGGEMQGDALRQRANRIHRDAIVVDTHNDVTSAILDEGFDLAMPDTRPNGKMRTHTDNARLKRGGVDAQFFAIYVGKEFVGKSAAEGGGPARRALDMIDIVYDQVARHPESLEMAYTAADIRRIARSGKVASLMGIEGGHAIEDSLHALRMFFRLGVRYMTLTHTNTNDWADSEGDLNNPRVKHHDGLTDFGKQVVLEMNRLGMMVDVSHVADKTFYDVIATTKAPVIASHSSARAISNHTRNMTDDMLRAMSKNGGVVMVNFYDGFIDPRKASVTLQSRAMSDELREKYPNDPRKQASELETWRAANAVTGKTPLGVLIDHFDHIIKVAGIDHVGMGADLDGIPLDGTPEGIEDVSNYPVITYELLKRGYSEIDVRKVLGENLLRVMTEVERVAHSQQAGAAQSTGRK